MNGLETFLLIAGWIGLYYLFGCWLESREKEKNRILEEYSKKEEKRKREEELKDPEKIKRMKLIQEQKDLENRREAIIEQLKLKKELTEDEKEILVLEKEVRILDAHVFEAGCHSNVASFETRHMLSEGRGNKYIGDMEGAFASKTSELNRLIDYHI